MARNQNTFEKMRREQEKKKKAEEKRERRRNKKEERDLRPDDELSAKEPDAQP